MEGPDSDAMGPASSPPDQPVETAPPARPRLWPVFLVVVFGIPVAVAITILIMGVTAVALDGWPAHLDRTYLDHVSNLPSIAVASVAGFEIGLAVVAVAPALLSPEPWYHRLGLVGFKGYGKTLPLFMLGTFAINNVFSVILPRFVGSPGEYLSPFIQTITDSTPFQQGVLILTATVVAGFVEEIVFRGYIQRRLLARWPVWLAIGATSVLFALAHMSLSYAAYILPLGIWLGLVAWRTGSTWCSIACHLFNNLMAIVVLYAGAMTGLGPKSILKMEAALAVAAVPIAIWAAVMLFRKPVAGRSV